MAVRIRLTRVGATKRPAYRVIAIDKRRSRDGRALEILGYYDPLTEPATVHLESDRIQAWIGQGAQPSDTVVKLMRQAEKNAQAAAAGSETDKAAGGARATKPRASRKAASATTTASATADPASSATADATSEPAAATPTEDAPAAGAETTEA